MRSAFASAIIVATTYGSLDACTPADYDAGFQSFMQGFQSDTTAIDTDCYAKVAIYTTQVRLFSESLQNLDTNDLMLPLYNASDITVAGTDIFTACQTTDLAKQLSIKFSTLAGFFDLAATFGVAFLKNYQTPDEENKLYSAMMGAQEAVTCTDTANYVG
jgi:hypothetical protein